jgi:hypothetical protein
LSAAETSAKDTSRIVTIPRRARQSGSARDACRGKDRGVPISDPHRLLFVHVPKNAGTAIAVHLGMRAQGHRTWRAYATDFPREWAAYTSFAVVRDPLDRFLSNVAYARMDRSHWHDRSGHAKHGPHPDFELCSRLSTLELAHVLAANPRALRHPGWAPQAPWITNDDGRVQVAHVLRHDRLAEDLRALGITDLPHVNVSDRANEEPITPELEALVRQAYARDYALFFAGSARAPIPAAPAAPPATAGAGAPPRASASFATFDDHLAALAPGLHVAEVGALASTNAERLSHLLAHGAASATKIDRTLLGHPAWAKLEARLAARGFAGRVNAMPLDLASIDARRDHGLFDLVHCSGVIFHLASPFEALLSLRSLTRRYLSLGSMTLPEVVTNEAGTLDLRGGAAFFGPALHGEARDTLRAHCMQLGLNVKNFQGASPMAWLDAGGTPSEAPWWWFWSAETLAHMTEAAGFRHHATYETWPGRAHTMLFEVR